MVTRTELRTERLLLRPFRAEDVADAQAYRDDEEFARYLPHIPQPFTRRDAERFVALNMGLDWSLSPTFAVVLDGQVIGSVNVEVEEGRPVAMLGFAIGRRWWGQGVAPEAARAVTMWAIEVFDLTRIWASTDDRNVRSRRVMRKLEMRREALRARDHVGRHGELVDEVVYGRRIVAGCGSRKGP